MVSKQEKKNPLKTDRNVGVILSDHTWNDWLLLHPIHLGENTMLIFLLLCAYCATNSEPIQHTKY